MPGRQGYRLRGHEIKCPNLALSSKGQLEASIGGVCELQTWWQLSSCKVILSSLGLCLSMRARSLMQFVAGRTYFSSRNLVFCLVCLLGGRLASLRYSLLCTSSWKFVTLLPLFLGSTVHWYFTSFVSAHLPSGRLLSRSTSLFVSNGDLLQ